ncbi:MAG TPA: hypothetical protein VM487_03075 [Phycisphaerae bacterium]|nr:hypothetical protein [Phycisphaerae bacterium]
MASNGLSTGEYTLRGTIDTDRGIPFSRVEKQLRVVSAEHARQLETLPLDAQAIANAAGLSTVKLHGGTEGAPSEAVVIPAGREVSLTLPGQGRVAVYGVVAAPSPEFSAKLGATTREVPAFKDGSYLVRERFLGVGLGGADTFRLQPKDGELRLAGIRVEPLPEGTSFVPGPANQGKQVVMNNDGGSEGFWNPSWNPETVLEQIDRYQGSDVSQFEFSTNLKDVAQGKKPGGQWLLSRADYLRRAAEAYAAGADGFYMFNAWDKPHVELVGGISDARFVANWRRYVDPKNLHTEIAGQAIR